MENTPHIELFIQFDGDSNVETFSIKEKDKFELVWNHCKKKAAKIEAITITESKVPLFESDCNKTIKELEIQTNSRLEVNESKPSGSLANINGQKSVKKLELAGEKRAIIVKGLNLRGRCPNTNCSSYKKMVVVQVGFQTCNVIEKLADSRCPICLEFFEPDTFIYFDCRYKVSGTYIDKSLKTNSKITIEPTTWEFTEKKQILSYAPDASGNKAWLELVIEAKSLDELT